MINGLKLQKLHCLGFMEFSTYCKKYTIRLVEIEVNGE
jgi:hypothetical protein